MGILSMMWCVSRDVCGGLSRCDPFSGREEVGVQGWFVGGKRGLGRVKEEEEEKVRG